MLLCCIQRNVEASCHTLKFVVVSRHQHRRLSASAATNFVNSLWSVAGYLRLNVLHLAFAARDGARHWLRIAIPAYPTCSALDSPITGVPVGILPWRLVPYGKTAPWWKKLKMCLFVSTESTNVTDAQTDTASSAWRHRPHLHSIVRQKSRRSYFCVERKKMQALTPFIAF